MNINFSELLPVIGVLVAVVNILSEVIKKMTWDKIPTNVVVTVLSIVLTLGAFVAYSQIKGFEVTWYASAGAVVVGFFVAYSAMFGFDKFKEAISWTKRGDNE